MRMRNSYFSLFLLVGLFAAMPNGLARQDLIPGSRYTSARGAALGDANLPYADDVMSGLFYNPAGLSKVNRFEITPVNVASYLNNDFFNLWNSNFYNAISLPAYVSRLKQTPGQFGGMGGQLGFGLGIPGVSIGFLLLSQVGAKSNGDGTVTWQSNYQLVPALGTGFKLGGGLLRVGYSLQWVNSAQGTVTAPDTGPIGYDLGLARGSTFSHTLGLTLTVPMDFLPTFNLVVRNVLDSIYNPFSLLPVSQGSTTLPNTEVTTGDASFSFQMILGKGALGRFVLQTRDLSDRTHVTYMAHIAAGMEVDFNGKLQLRGGFGSGYPCAGIGIKRRGAQFDLSVYSEEIGSGYLSQKDTRYLLQYQMGNF